MMTSISKRSPESLRQRVFSVRKLVGCFERRRLITLGERSFDAERHAQAVECCAAFFYILLACAVVYATSYESLSKHDSSKELGIIGTGHVRWCARAPRWSGFR